MSEMKRLLDGTISADAERLLRAAAAAAPPSAEEKQAKIVEVFDAALPSAASAPSRTFSRGMWIALAVVIGLAGSLAGGLYSRPQVASRPAEIATPPAERSPAESLPPPEPAVRVEDLPSAPAPRVASPASSPTVVRDELGEIDGARAALAADQASEALSRLDRWRKTFSSPRYAEEGEALEVQALTALGRRDEARAKGERFLAARPHSPYERRIRATIGQVQP